MALSCRFEIFNVEKYYDLEIRSRAIKGMTFELHVDELHNSKFSYLCESGTIR